MMSDTLRATLLSLKQISDKLSSLFSSIGNVPSGDTIYNKLDDISYDVKHIDVDTSDLSKQGNDPGATNTAIYHYLSTNVPTEEYMKQMYSAHFEKNNDGENSYTVVLPITATIDEEGNEIIVTI